MLDESGASSRLDAAETTGLTPLVGREQEVGLLRERWAQVKDGLGQVVLLSGEAGIGKSRLVQVLQGACGRRAPGVADAVPLFALSPEQRPVSRDRACCERCPALRPGGVLPQQKLRKLERLLVQYGLPLAEAVPLFAALLSLPLPADVSPPDADARAAEAEDPGSPAGLLLA